MQANVAVVILNYNGENFLRQFLPSVISNSKGSRIIVADNASTDSSSAILRSFFPEVEFLELDQNYGFAEGYNQALKRIKAEFYVLLNSDVEVTTNWLNPLIRLLKENPAIAACQPKILAYDDKRYFEYAGASGGFVDWLGYPFCRGRIFDTLEQDHGQYDDAIPVFWATGACMAIRASVFQDLGGFDGNFFAHMEEIDLCWRIHNAGLNVYVCPESKVYHVGGGTLPKSNPRKTYLNFRNGLLMLYKNSTRAETLLKLPLRLSLDWIAALQMILNGKTEEAKSIFKAHSYFLTRFRAYKEKKSANLKNRKSKAPLYRKLVIWEYFIKKRKKYSDLPLHQIYIKKIQIKKQPI